MGETSRSLRAELDAVKSRLSEALQIEENRSVLDLNKHLHEGILKGSGLRLGLLWSRHTRLADTPCDANFSIDDELCKNTRDDGFEDLHLQCVTLKWLLRSWYELRCEGRKRRAADALEMERKRKLDELVAGLRAENEQRLAAERR